MASPIGSNRLASTSWALRYWSNIRAMEVLPDLPTPTP